MARKARQDAPRYPIRAVARLTGITVDTLRAWERRYHVVSPTRDDRGRLYSDVDLRRLQLLAAAVDRGHAIGRIARVSDAELERLIAAPRLPAVLAPVPDSGRSPVAMLLEAVNAFDYAGVERELNRLTLSLSPRDLVHRVVLPVMRRVGEDWHNERLSVAQEHLISAALRSLLGAMVRLYARLDSPRRLMFATPGGERHEFGVLAAAMLTAAGGLGVVYLGPDLPGRQIVDAAAPSGVEIVVLATVNPEATRDIRRNLEYTIDHLPPPIELWIGGDLPAELEPVLSRPRVVRLRDFESFERQLARVGARF